MAIDLAFSSPATDAPTRRLWTRDEYHRLAEQGYFDGQRVELIEGEIVVMSPQGAGHFAAIHLVVAALQTALGPGYWIRNQGPLSLNSTSEPEPDVAVVPGSPRDYREHPPTALLAVEVSDSTRAYDLGRKSKMYAASHGIPEYWVVDLVDRVLYVMLDPQQGEYRSVQKHDLSGTVKPKAISSQPIQVADLFP